MILIFPYRVDTQIPRIAVRTSSPKPYLRSRHNPLYFPLGPDTWGLLDKKTRLGLPSAAATCMDRVAAMNTCIDRSPPPSDDGLRLRASRKPYFVTDFISQTMSDPHRRPNPHTCAGHARPRSTSIANYSLPPFLAFSAGMDDEERSYWVNSPGRARPPQKARSSSLTYRRCGSRACPAESDAQCPVWRQPCKYQVRQRESTFIYDRHRPDHTRFYTAPRKGA